MTRAGDPGGPSSAPMSMRSMPPPPGRRVTEYVYRVRLRNDGAKAVSGVDWEYQFLDAETAAELGRHRFQSLAAVKAGRSRTVEAASAAPPAKVVSAAALGRRGKAAYRERVLVRCVAYADGTVRWHDAGGASDCERLKQLAAARRD